jgi:integrase
MPVVGTGQFKKQFKTKDQKGRKLNTPSLADSFCEYIKEKLDCNEDDFDPREIGTKEERDFFLVKNSGPSYLSFHKSRVGKDKITPAGYVKKERVMRLYILPTFGECSVKELNYQVINRRLAKADFTDSIQTETLKELRVYFKWAVIEGLIKAIPELPKQPKQKKFKAEDFYSMPERNLVISNIQDRKIQIAILIIANYTRRKSEVECLRWGDIDFKKKEIKFSRHLSDGRGDFGRVELDGLKSSPDKVLTFDFFPGLHTMLLELDINIVKSELVFKGKGGSYLGKNVLYDNWKKSALELIKRGKLAKFVDLHRGTRNSTLSALYQDGKALEMLVELYGGDIKTLKEHYAKKTKQNTKGIWDLKGMES